MCNQLCLNPFRVEAITVALGRNRFAIGLTNFQFAFLNFQFAMLIPASLTQ